MLAVRSRDLKSRYIVREVLAREELPKRGASSIPY